MRLEVLDSAVVQDAAGNVIYNAWQQDAVVGRLSPSAATPSRTPSPSAKRATGQPYPFVVLDSGGTHCWRRRHRRRVLAYVSEAAGLRCRCASAIADPSRRLRGRR